MIVVNKQQGILWYFDISLNVTRINREEGMYEAIPHIAVFRLESTSQPPQLKNYPYSRPDDYDKSMEYLENELAKVDIKKKE